MRQRLSTYDTGRADNIEVVYTYETNDIVAVESCVKSLLKENQYRKYKEVYEADIDMIKGIIKDCADLKMKYKNRKPTKLEGGYFIACFHND